MSILEVFSQPFMIRAVVSGLSVGLMMSVLGVFVTLKKQAFFSDGISHASLLGVAIGLLLGQSVLSWTFIIAGIVSVIMTFLLKKRVASGDSAIGVVYTVAFALAISLLYIYPSYRSDLFTYLFGSVLTITWSEMWLSVIGMSVVMLVISTFFNQFLYATFDEDAARVRGIRVDLLEYATNIMTALAIVLAVKLVGVVLVSGMIVIPAVTARLFAKKFNDMFKWSAAVSVISVIGGLMSSFFVNSPSGAAIVIWMGSLFGIGMLVKYFSKKL